MLKDIKTIIYRLLWNNNYNPNNNKYHDLFNCRPNEDLIHYQNTFAINDRVLLFVGGKIWLWSSDTIRSFIKGTYINIPLSKNY